MADDPGRTSSTRRLDASGPREVVFCHQCENEWWQDEHGLVCPMCECEITEIITPESDPRPDHGPPPSEIPREMPDRHDYDGWRADDDNSDPEEADIEEHITHGPGGSVLFSRTVRTSTPRSAFGIPRRRGDPADLGNDDPDNVMRDFQNMIGNLMGPGFRPGQAGRSGADTLFTQGTPFGGQAFRAGDHGPGPAIVGGRFTFTTNGGRLRPRDLDGPQHPAGPPVDDLATIIGGLFGPMSPPGQQAGPHVHGGMPPGLQGLFAAMLNPANARAGDAVYSQEALDQIISTLMEQHPTSNAPGPASPDAIAALPKKKLDEKQLGPEGKGECSVCMDDVTIGEEVVMLPCSHWFHEACASAWLSEHNTCPICRKGIEGETAPNANGRRSSQSSPTSRNEHRARRLSTIRPRMDRYNSNLARNEARPESIRNSGRMSPNEEPQAARRWHIVGDPSPPTAGRDEDYASPMPGAFYRRGSEMSENQRDSRRGNTSGSDRSWETRRSSHSGNSGNGGGALGWIRDRFGGNRRTE